MTMNATNCSDGVDGLAGTLTLMSLFALAIFLYGVVGHEKISAYLLIPHNPEGARWGILTATVAGGIAGYLWYNAEPSKVLMGDAGSRFLGLLVGIAVLVCGNPFLVLVVAPIVLVNGGTGLLKLSLLKMLTKFGFETTNPNQNSGGSADQNAQAKKPCWMARQLHRVRFPLHDHCRRNLKWSNAQVLMRFVLIQTLLMPILFIILVKIR
jgi:phospho-N-acetylmuramoyl-pentapeptide-transferase